MPKPEKQFQIGDWVYFDPTHRTYQEMRSTIDTVRGVVTSVEDGKFGQRVAVDWEDGFTDEELAGQHQDHPWLAWYLLLV